MWDRTGFGYVGFDKEEMKSLETHLENTKRCKRTHLLLQGHLKDQEW
jgi:hypothetical protein